MKKEKRIMFCPQCENTDIMLINAYSNPTYECKKCGCSNTSFPIKFKLLREIKKK
jgi:Zn ribbon nucleic-acid-binding protein